MLLKVCKIINDKRITVKTGMNETSSRSHFLCRLKLYRKEGDKFTSNHIQFLDMAGSEKLSKSGVDPNSEAGF